MELANFVVDVLGGGVAEQAVVGAICVEDCAISSNEVQADRPVLEEVAQSRQVRRVRYGWRLSFYEFDRIRMRSSW